MSISGGIAVACGAKASTFVDFREGNQIDVKRARTFWRNVERFPAGAPIADVVDCAGRRIIIVSGWVSEFRVLPDGRRQIFSFLLPGDTISLRRATHGGQRSLMALTNVEIADAAALSGGPDAATNSAALIDALQDHEERLLDHMVRIGRLTAKERVLNLLLELHDRLNAIGLVKEGAFRLPLTQEMFADALGLSVVHINRTLQQLRREGMIVVRRGSVTLTQRQKLAMLASYQPSSRLAQPTGEHLVA
jgi:CRP-like cAMP-binding protein